MQKKEKWLLWIFVLLLAKKVAAGHRAPMQRRNWKLELALMQCLCTTETENRVKNIHFCMNRYSGNQMKFSDSVQYCGYFAEQTQFGKDCQTETAHIELQPYEYTYDYYTDKTCNHTRYTPGVYGPATITYVGQKAWVIGRCIFDVSGLNGMQVRDLLQDCCYF